MEKGGRSNSLLGWLGLLGLLIGIAVGAALGYLETARRFEANEMAQRIHYLEMKLAHLNNITEHLQLQLQVRLCVIAIYFKIANRPGLQGRDYRGTVKTNAIVLMQTFQLYVWPLSEPLPISAAGTSRLTILLCSS